MEPGTRFHRQWRHSCTCKRQPCLPAPHATFSPLHSSSTSSSASTSRAQAMGLGSAAGSISHPVTSMHTSVSRPTRPSRSCFGRHTLHTVHPPPRVQPQASSLQPPPATHPAPGVAVSEEDLKHISMQLSKFGIAHDVKDIKPGRGFRRDCPFCNGGNKADKHTFSVVVHDSGRGASAKCWRAKCGYEAHIGATTNARTAPARPPKLLEELSGEALEFFGQLGVGGAARACGVRQATGVMDIDDAPSLFAVLSYSCRGEPVLMQNVEVPSARAFLQQLRRSGAALPLKISEEAQHLVAAKPGAKPASVLWGYDDAMRLGRRRDGAEPFSPAAGQEGVEPGGHAAGQEPVVDAAAAACQDLFVVEDALDRLALVQAGLHPGQVVSLPPLAKQRFLAFLVSAKAARADPKKKRKEKHAAAATGSMLSASRTDLAVFDYVAEAGELLDSFHRGRIVIALHSSEASVQLGEELARVVGPERCARLRWPAAPEELSGSSPNSASSASSQQQQSSVAGMLGGFYGLDPEQRKKGADAVEDGSGVQQQRQWDEAAAAQAFAMRVSAHDVLTKDGAQALLWHALNMAVEMPLKGLFQFSSFRQEIMDYYSESRPGTMAVSSGWGGLDQFYKVIPGELTVVTGVPNSGKSEWLDALAVNLAETYSWPIAFCSFEKSVRHHAAQLMEKFTDMTFFSDVRGLPRLSREDFHMALDFIDDHFFLIRRDGDRTPQDPSSSYGNYEELYPGSSSSSGSSDGVWQPSYLTEGREDLASRAAEVDEVSPTIDWVLEKATAAVKRHGIRGLVIDPYNELDHSRQAHISETEYISQMLSKIKRFAQRYDVHVWLVAHPRQLQDWQGDSPSLYDISGSAHFINKADCGVVVHRNWGDSTDKNVQIMMQKVRNKAAGKIGKHELVYDVGTGRYRDSNEI